MGGIELEGFKGLFDLESLSEESVIEQLISVPIALLKAGKYQPRNGFNDDSLKELSDSIKSNGVIQPLIVRKDLNSQYEIIAGERRWRAATMAGLLEVPVIVRDISDDTALVFALIENIQREDLNPMDRVAALVRLKDEFSMTHEKIASVVGLSRSAVTNFLRLMGLPEEVKTLLQSGDLGVGQAKPLLSLDNPEQQVEIAHEIVNKALSARAAENLIQKIKTLPQSIKSLDPMVKEKTQHWNTVLSKRLSSFVQVHLNQKGQGRVVIRTDSFDELEWLVERLRVETFD